MIGDALRAVLPELRQQAESMMVTPCAIHRGGTVTADPATGADVIVGGVSVYDGGCAFLRSESEVRDAEVADSTTAERRIPVAVPVGSGPFLRGDVLSALGSTFRVEAIRAKTWEKSQKLYVVEVL